MAKLTEEYTTAESFSSDLKTRRVGLRPDGTLGSWH